jgi:stage III sporulation protein AD
MEMVKLLSIGIVAAVLGTVLKQKRPEFAVQLGMAAAGLVFLLVAGNLSDVLEFFTELAARAGVAAEHLKILFKIVAISYITEFGTQLCRDAGENAVAAKLEIAGRILIIAAAMPIMRLVADVIMEIGR